MVRKELDAKILLAALVITSLIFASGVGVGWSLNNEKVAIIDKQLSDINRDVESFQIETLFLNTFGTNATCKLLDLRLGDINKQSNDVGNKLEIYGENKRMNKDSTYVKLRSQYTRLLVTYWLLAKEMKKNCPDTNFVTTLYFFSEDCRDCDAQSFVLTYYKDKLGDRLLNFALDTSFSEPSMSIVKNFYNVTDYPTLVVEDEKYTGFRSKDELKGIFCKYQNFTVCYG